MKRRHKESDLQDFGAQVNEVAAKLVGTELAFGSRKAYIAGVWSKMREAANRRNEEFPGLEDFKSMLLEAHRAGTVELARADLTSAMDPLLVKKSWTHDRQVGSEFTFVMVD